jgi:hypothetical protein
VNEKDIKEEYYLMSIHDYRKGTTISTLKGILKLYEDTEMYEQCAGIHKAIQEIEMRELIKITKLIRNKNGRSNN